MLDKADIEHSRAELDIVPEGEFQLVVARPPV
jgi:hypothetical protein